MNLPSPRKLSARRSSSLVVGCTLALTAFGVAAGSGQARDGTAGASVSRGAPVSADDGLTARAASHKRKPAKRRRLAQIGDSPCFADPEARPRVEFDVIRGVNETGPPSAYELGVPFSICISGFDAAQAIDAVVFLPNGTRRSQRLAPSDSGFLPRPWEFFTFPPDPLGAYRVLATQGSVSATGTFTIVAPMRPKLELLRYEIRAGNSVPVALSGFAAREKIELYLYRGTGYSPSDYGPQRVFTLRGRVASFRVDARGFARRRVVVRRPGDYQLAAGAVFNHGFGFSVLPPR